MEHKNRRGGGGRLTPLQPSVKSPSKGGSDGKLFQALLRYCYHSRQRAQTREETMVLRISDQADRLDYESDSPVAPSRRTPSARSRSSRRSLKSEPTKSPRPNTPTQKKTGGHEQRVSVGRPKCCLWLNGGSRRDNKEQLKTPPAPNGQQNISPMVPILLC